MSQTVELKVGMSCQGCVGAVKRVLGKLDVRFGAPLLAFGMGFFPMFWSYRLSATHFHQGVESYDIDLEKQKVTVKGNVQPEKVLQTVSKTGKATSFWEEAKPPAAEAESKPTESVAVA